MRKKGLLFLAICLLINVSFLLPVQAYGAGEKGGHNDILRRVLFGENGYVSNTDALDTLNDAVALSVDQYNGSGENYLSELKETFHITGLPKSIKEIDFSANSTSHRWYTHQGWSYPYSEDKSLDVKSVKDSNFDLRKEILLTTVNQVFDFGLLSGKLFFSYDKKCEAFAKFLYYMHILGDYEEIYEKNYPYSNHKLIPLVKGSSNYGLIDEMEECFKVLFDDQTDDRTYLNLKTELARLKKDISKVGNYRNDPDEYTKYIGYSHELLQTLIQYVPLLMKKETFFQKVFYKDMLQ